jgi:hypothetical protein
MKKLTLNKFVAGLMLVGVLAMASGCNTPEPENRSARPWNAPKGWEGGLPVGLTEGR